MALVRIKCAIEGVTPLLTNRFPDDTDPDGQGGRSGSKDKGTAREQAEAKLYVGVDGKTLMIPSPNLFRCIIDAGTFFKVGKSKVTTIKNSLIPACLSIEPLELPIIHKEPWDIDQRAVRNPATGGRFICYRPCFRDWRLEFELELDTDLISVKLLREIVDAAGRRIGLGDFRPDRKGPFGKFVVVVWEVEKLVSPKKEEAA